MSERKGGWRKRRSGLLPEAAGATGVPPSSAPKPPPAFTLFPPFFSKKLLPLLLILLLLPHATSGRRRTDGAMSSQKTTTQNISFDDFQQFPFMTTLLLVRVLHNLNKTPFPGDDNQNQRTMGAAFRFWWNCDMDKHWLREWTHQVLHEEMVCPWIPLVAWVFRNVQQSLASK